MDKLKKVNKKRKKKKDPITALSKKTGLSKALLFYAAAMGIKF